MSVEEMTRHIGVDSLSFLSFDGLYQAVCGENRNEEAPQFCDACFTGDYPVALIDQRDGAAPAQLTLLAESA